MKLICTLLMATCFYAALAQEKYLTKTGEVIFEASVPAFEEVKATNKSVTVILNTENGEFAALVFVKAFRFKNALMEEHFNENYADSDTYPKAKFKGQINTFNKHELTDLSMTYTYSGTLEFHGKTKALNNLELTAAKTSGGAIVLQGNVLLNVKDFDIAIPKIVSNKLSENVMVDFEFELSKM